MSDIPLKKIKVNINGMHCSSCEVLIERSFKKIEGVEKVKVNHASGKAELQCSEEPSLEQLNQVIKGQGYSVSGVDSSKPSYYQLKRDHLEIGAIFVIVVGLYLLLKQFDILPKGIGISENMGYGIVFLIGLVAAFSTCMAVTGGLLLSISAKYNEQNQSLTGIQKFKPHIYFNLGRVVSYTLLGGLLGVLGSVLIISPKVTGILIIVVSLIMILLGLQILNIFSWSKYLQPKMPKFIAHKILDANTKSSKSGSFLFGASTFFLPCGFTQALQLYVLSQGSFAVGALTMLVFSLGTLPGLISLGAISSFAKGVFQKYFTKTAAVVVILLGALSLVNGFALTGSVIGVNSISDNIIGDSGIKIVEGKQIVEMEINGLDYTPATFTLKQGIPVEWRINGKNARGCASVISVPNLGITEYIPKDAIKTIEFTPEKTGAIRFTCSMGMAGPGTFNILANDEDNKPSLQAEFNSPVFQGEVQKLKMEISKENGFYPNTFTVKKDIPVELEIDAKIQLNGCMSVLVIPDYDIAHKLTLGKSMLRFTPTKIGTSEFTCSMGSHLGNFLVI